ncbi:hypothetical protein AU210_015794 [Fusarium oxysporum f. sp. radicis-cucumerinum]|uniref:Uncharacterized protein n=1 Tax=Fusarium oxysporum f. sp. radicis-cucumerinum TaxID=327505 RepID=A0A2H3FRD8_FUSOX|nr:hypothetical protein AU210_015794 [Fusarium oxysporum f. sp. radicis-cucumerinum]
MNGKAPSVSYVGKAGNQLETIHDFATRRSISLNSNAQHGNKSPFQILLGLCICWMGLGARPQYPANVGTGFKVLGKFCGIFGVSLSPETERLDTVVNRGENLTRRRSSVAVPERVPVPKHQLEVQANQ